MLSIAPTLDNRASFLVSTFERAGQVDEVATGCRTMKVATAARSMLPQL